MQSPPFPRYLIPPRSKYSPQHHILKHPQLPFLPCCQRRGFTPIQNNRQNYSSIYLEGLYLKTINYSKIWLNNKAVHHTTLGKTQRMIGLLCAASKAMSYFINIFSLTKVVTFSSGKLYYFC